MKRCKYCGKEYPDGGEICVVDEQPLESVQPLRAESETGCSDRKRGGVSRWIGIVAVWVVLAGGVFAFHSYVTQFNFLKPHRAERAKRAVKLDTRSALAQRFVLGAGCGALLGVYFAARDANRKQ